MKKFIPYLILFILLVFVYNIRSILFPFVISIIFAYLLDPIADFFEKRKINRSVSCFIILSVFFTFILTAIVFLVPLFLDELKNFVLKIPTYKNNFDNKILPYFLEIAEKIDPSSVSKIKAELQNYASELLKFLGQFFSSVWSSSLEFVHFFSLLILTPFIAFYFLRDFDHIVKKIGAFLPKKYYSVIKEQAIAIDSSISAYLRGQITVCIIMSVLYSLLFLYAKLEFAFFLGITSGLLTIVPYVGMVAGLGTALIIALLQYHDFSHILQISIGYTILHFTEGHFITPKIIGDKIGLHPVWIIFAMLVMAKFLGLLGLLIAVPIAAIINTLIKYNYKYLSDSN